MKIDVVSDVACPWCAIGLAALERALERLRAEGFGPVELVFQPFELNPQMPPEGEDAAEHLMRKYGMGREQLAQARAQLVARAAALGLRFGERSRVWNTFDAHRLLAAAATEGPPGAQLALKRALLQAYHGDGLDPGDPSLLRRLGVEAGLAEARVGEIVDGDAYAEAVRKAEKRWQRLGISAVPSVIVDDRHLIQGGQPPEVFEQALRRIAAGQA